jgi:hypothetical protein
MFEHFLATEGTTTAYSDRLEAAVSCLKGELQSWLARLHTAKMELEARDDMKAHRDSVVQKWRKLNPAVFEDRASLPQEFMQPPAGAVLSPEAAALQSVMEKVDTLCTQSTVSYAGDYQVGNCFHAGPSSTGPAGSGGPPRHWHGGNRDRDRENTLAPPAREQGFTLKCWDPEVPTAVIVFVPPGP